MRYRGPKSNLLLEKKRHEPSWYPSLIVSFHKQLLETFQRIHNLQWKQRNMLWHWYPVLPIQKKSIASFITYFPFLTAWSAFRLATPPMGSHGPFPWLASITFHEAVTPKCSLWQLIILNMVRFRCWLVGESIQ